MIAAEEIYSTISTLGCDWNTLVVGHSENVRWDQDGVRGESLIDSCIIPELGV